MSFQNQSGDLGLFTEVVPASAQFGAPERSSILTSRRRVKIVPQTGAQVGAAGAGGGSQQIQFLLSDNSGLVDMRSICLNYNIQTSGAALPVPDDGHVFSTVQVLLNGQLLENIQSAGKLFNAEVCMGGSKTYYETAGSFQGLELLNGDMILAPPAATVAPTQVGSYGFVANNVSSIQARTARAAAPVFNNIAGESRSIPLGMIAGIGRMATYLPISLVGELAVILQTGAANEQLFSVTASQTAADFSLSNINLEFDVVTPDSRYFSVLQRIAGEETGLIMPYESSVVSTGAAIAASTTLTENSIIVSRATNNLLRSNIVFIPTAQASALGYPSQSAFSHAGVYSVQWRIGSLVYPQTACQGDAALFNMSMAAYGSVMQENGTICNRVLWGNSTNGATQGTAAVFETSEISSGGTVKFAYGDRFVPSYGFRTVKGGAEPLAVDGVSVAGASGSQVIISVISAPGTAYTPYVILTALKFIVAKNGGVQIVGA